MYYRVCIIQLEGRYGRAEFGLLGGVFIWQLLE